LKLISGLAVFQLCLNGLLKMVFSGSVSSRKSRLPTVKRGRVYTEYPCKHRWYRGVKLRPIQDEAFLVLTGISVLSGIENNT